MKIIDENAHINTVKQIIATKIDLKNVREVSKEDATEFCQKYDWFTEITSTSSKTGENVEEAFLFVAKKIIKNNLQICKPCGEVFNKKLKICQYCGAKVEIEVNPIQNN